MIKEGYFGEFVDVDDEVDDEVDNEVDDDDETGDLTPQVAETEYCTCDDEDGQLKVTGNNNSEGSTQLRLG